MTMPFRARRYWNEVLKGFEEEEKVKPRQIPEDLNAYLLATTDGTVKRALHSEGDDYFEGTGWWYLPDNTKVEKARPLLVAHVDTLCKPFPPSIVGIDTDRQIWTPDGILGADDRAGVAACMELRRKLGLAVLLCDGEESGGWGASSAARQAGDMIRQHPYMIELDRQGFREVVYYRTEHRNFKDLFTNVGYWEFSGSFSDIAILSRALDVPGANVSVGFRYQHTKYECLHLGAFEDTIRRLSMLIEKSPTYVRPPGPAPTQRTSEQLYLPSTITPAMRREEVQTEKENQQGLYEEWWWKDDMFYHGH